MGCALLGSASAQEPSQTPAPAQAPPQNFWEALTTRTPSQIGQTRAAPPQAAPSGAETAPAEADPSGPTQRRSGQQRSRRAASAPTAAPTAAPTFTLIAGGLGGTHAQMAADLAAALQDSGVRVRPMLGQGSNQDLKDLLRQPDIDMALVQADAVERLKRDPEAASSIRQLAYLARLHNDEVHVVARNELRDLRDLQGRTLGVVGPGAAEAARRLFEHYEIQPELAELDGNLALERLKAGEIDAVMMVGGKPIPALAAFRAEGRFQLLPLAYDLNVQETYLPAELTASDYPDLVPAGRGVDTLAVPSVLVIKAPPRGSTRHRALVRFTEAFMAGANELAKPGRHPKWQEANVAATLPGWTRFRPAAEWLAKAQPRTAKAAGPGTATR